MLVGWHGRDRAGGFGGAHRPRLFLERFCFAFARADRANAAWLLGSLPAGAIARPILPVEPARSEGNA